MIFAADYAKSYAAAAAATFAASILMPLSMLMLPRHAAATLEICFALRFFFDALLDRFDYRRLLMRRH